MQAEVLSILDDLVRDRGMGLIFISHDLRLVARFCDRVLVMYKGRVVEELAAENLLDAKHPYTQGLLNCLPRIGGTASRCRAWTATQVGRTDMALIEIENLSVTFRAKGREVRAVQERQPVGRRSAKASAWSAKAARASPPSCARSAAWPRCRAARSASAASRCPPRAASAFAAAGADGVPGPLRQPAPAPHHRPHPVRTAGHPRPAATPIARVMQALADVGLPASSASATRTSCPAASASASPSPAR